MTQAERLKLSRPERLALYQGPDWLKALETLSTWPDLVIDNLRQNVGDPSGPESKSTE